MLDFREEQLPQVIDELGHGRLETWQLPINENFLRTLFDDIFCHYWQVIQFGMLVQGGVMEFTPPAAPTKIGYLDGYLTVEFGNFGHLHICLGWNKGLGCCPTEEKVASLRLPSRVELYRKLNRKGQPTMWALRVYNSRQPDPEQTLHIFLPNPLLTTDHNYAKIPDWTKLELWDYLRRRYLGMVAIDTKDRTACHFSHD